MGEIDKRLIATMRLVLSSALLFIINPLDLDDLDAFHILAALYTAYSALRFIFSGHQVQPLRSKIPYWSDVSWATLLIAVGDDSSSAMLFLFPIVLIAFQRGFMVSLRLTLIAVMLLVTVSFVKAHLRADLQLQLIEIILPPLYLLVFGYVMASWGGRELAAKRRLVLLKDIINLSNPRFGIDRTIGSMLEKLCAFHNARACLLIVTDPASNEHLLRRTDRRDPERASVAESIPTEIGQLLLEPPLEQTIIYHGAVRAWECWRFPKATYSVFDAHQGWHIAAAHAMNEALITVLDAECFVSVPLHYPNNSTGRLYLTAARRHAFSCVDAGFLRHVIEQMIPAIENIRLVDQLASSAAEEERHRLARDIHDTVIQPYIGFQLALAAVSQKLRVSTSDITNDIAQLIVITEQGITALRRYMQWLAGNGKRESALLGAVWRFVATFTETTHIAVQVEAASDLYINDRLAAEVFQMVVEGLSNIRRHTDATCATIGLACQHNCLILRIVNNGADASTPVRFTPQSIAGRAAALGGQVRVEQVTGAGTRVIIEIPL